MSLLDISVSVTVYRVSQLGAIGNILKQKRLEETARREAERQAAEATAGPEAQRQAAEEMQKE